MAAQRPIRSAEALAWDSQTEHEFLAAGGRVLPRLDREYYRSRRLPFDPSRKQEELQDLERDTQRLLGADSPAGRILTRICRELVCEVRLLVYRGTTTFSQISQRLYGSSLSTQTEAWLQVLDELERSFPVNVRMHEPRWTAKEAAEVLRHRLAWLHPGCNSAVQVVDSSDSTDATSVRLDRDRKYSALDLRYYESYYGWSQFATSYNGHRQLVCSFLAVPSASASGTQKALACLTAFAAGAMTAERVQPLRQMIAAIRMAEAGANFCEVFDYFRSDGGDERVCYRKAQRVFAGSLPARCGPLTKELRAAAALYQLRNAFRSEGPMELLPFLFAGVTAVEDLPYLRQLSDEGWLSPPQFLPPLDLYSDIGTTPPDDLLPN